MQRTDTFLEDFSPGQVYRLGTRGIGRDDIVAFARDYDPQPFHLDEEEAARSAFGGLIASGWQTAGLFMRLLVDGLLRRTASMGSPGVQDLRWLRPVRPGDELSATLRVEEVAPSRTRADRGTIRFTGELGNQRGETVMTMVAVLIIGRRPDGGA
ncbi:MaoC family dehydratase [Arenibaculum sp.]|jgi:acyl dehydratase|uniref:MaoC family dehydratase n=1 Tax=Arenibaculum sp. TaxID=2865862 RepID=UPI002E14D322|nr:MaoC family dehydratase [Arenibaculum sp.]